MPKVLMEISMSVDGYGTRLFDGVRPEVGLVPREAFSSLLVTHLTYDVERAAGRERR